MSSTGPLRHGHPPAAPSRGTLRPALQEDLDHWRGRRRNPGQDLPAGFEARRAGRRQHPCKPLDPDTPYIVHAAVEGIALACVPEPDEILRDLLAEAIGVCAAWSGQNADHSTAGPTAARKLTGTALIR